MAFNFFQKFSQKKGLPKASVGKTDKAVRKEKVVEREAAETKKTEVVAIKHGPHEKNIFASKYIVSPHISEKASFLQEVVDENKGISYVFKVTKNATKQLLKKAVADRYNVKINSIHIMNTPGKEIRRGKITGRKAGYKKAIIKLQPGNTIEQL